jgi:hypothetical protein
MALLVAIIALKVRFPTTLFPSLGLSAHTECSIFLVLLGVSGLYGAVVCLLSHELHEIIRGIFGGVIVISWVGIVNSHLCHSHGVWHGVELV